MRLLARSRRFALLRLCRRRGGAALRRDIAPTITGTVTLGTGIRTEEPSPQNYGRLAGNRVGRAGGLTSVNSGGPDLNFPKGKPYSTPLKGFVDFDLQRRNFGAFARLKGLVRLRARERRPAVRQPPESLRAERAAVRCGVCPRGEVQERDVHRCLRLRPLRARR